jgi:iron(III) transport system substrate-binding protein
MKGRSTWILWTAAALSACGRPAHVVVVYTPLDADVVGWAKRAYRDAHPDVDLRLVPMSSRDVLARLSTERADPAAGVVWGAPSWILAAAADEGLLAAELPPWASALAPDLRDRDGRWAASLLDPLVLAFNHDRLTRSRAPRDWIDLFHPRFAGELLLPEPGRDDGASVLLGAHAQASQASYGDILDAIDWFTRLDGQCRGYEADEKDLLMRLGRGVDGSVAPVRLSRAEAARRDGSAVEYVVPESGGPILVQGVAVVAGGPQPEAARAFVAWLGSPEVTSALARELHRVPATAAPDAPELGWLADAPTALSGKIVPAGALAEHLDAWVARWRSDARGRGAKVYVPGG